MTSLRYESYRRVLAILDEIETPELEHDERELLRDASEGLLLTRRGEEDTRDEILLDAWLVLSSLVRTGRWRYRAADQVRRMLEACGPGRAPAACPPRWIVAGVRDGARLTRTQTARMSR